MISLVFILSTFLLINSIIMVLRGGMFGRFSFEFNGMPGVLIGIIVGFFSAIVSYGYILDMLKNPTDTTYTVLAVSILIISIVSWFLQYKLLR